MVSVELTANHTASYSLLIVSPCYWLSFKQKLDKTSCSGAIINQEKKMPRLEKRWLHNLGRYMFRVTQPTADTLAVYFDFVVNISHSKPGKLSLITPLNEHKSDLSNLENKCNLILPERDSFAENETQFQDSQDSFQNLQNPTQINHTTQFVKQWPRPSGKVLIDDSKANIRWYQCLANTSLPSDIPSQKSTYCYSTEIKNAEDTCQMECLRNAMKFPRVLTTFFAKHIFPR